MVPTTLSNQYISIDLLFTIGFGDRLGFVGHRLGIGVIGRVGTRLIPVGHIVTTMYISMFITTTTLVAPTDTPRSQA